MSQTATAALNEKDSGEVRLGKVKRKVEPDLSSGFFLLLCYSARTVCS